MQSHPVEARMSSDDYECIYIYICFVLLCQSLGMSWYHIAVKSCWHWSARTSDAAMAVRSQIGYPRTDDIFSESRSGKTKGIGFIIDLAEMYQIVYISKCGFMWVYIRRGDSICFFDRSRVSDQGFEEQIACGPKVYFRLITPTYMSQTKYVFLRIIGLPESSEKQIYSFYSGLLSFSFQDD